MPFQDSKYSYYDEYSISGQGIQLRKLNQPFNWHNDDDEEPDPNKEDASDADGAGGSNGGGGSNGSNKTTKFCRNSVQGKMLIADDTGEKNKETTISREIISHSISRSVGRVCHRNDLQQNGCCNENATSTHDYKCEGCHEASGCCKVYEHCISCCMDPKKVRFTRDFFVRFVERKSFT